MLIEIESNLHAHGPLVFQHTVDEECASSLFLVVVVVFLRRFSVEDFHLLLDKICREFCCQYQ